MLLIAIKIEHLFNKIFNPKKLTSQDKLDLIKNN